jgi:uncharacterized protein (TIGR03437 family)
VGAGYYGFGGDGTPAWTAGFAYPSGVAIDKAGNLFIADWHNQRVRKVTPGAGQPVISPDGVVNGASSARGAAGLAPGSVVSIFGQWLAPYAAKATAVPLPRTVFHVPVSANVRAGAVTAQMPLFYVSPDQINAQLPVELPLGPASVTVQTANVESLPIAITIVPAAPGIFVYEDNRAVALNQDSRLNRTILPAERGSIISVYLTGQGELSPPVPSGQAAPLDVLSWAVMSPAASIGGVPAPVVFLGAAPGFVGLAQANITVPMDAPVGDQPLSITIGGVESNRPKISIK